jgi:hypothetical protein
MQTTNVSVLTGPSSVCAPLYDPQCAEMSQVCQCMSIEMDMNTVIGAACMFECVHGTVRRCAYWGWYNGWTVALYNCVLPDDGSVRAETCSSLLIVAFFIILTKRIRLLVTL